MKHNFGKPWGELEDSILESSYGKIKKDKLLSLLPNRTWGAIRERARKLGHCGVLHTGENKYEITPDMCCIILDRRNGDKLRSLIDIHDIERVVNYGKWSPNNVNNAIYARRKNIMLHRFIVDCPRDKEVDHINGDTLDNRRSNLRIVSRSENNQNRSITNPNNKTSGIKNISWNKSLEYWVVRVKTKGIIITKYAKTLEEAKQKANKLRALLHSHTRA